MTRTRCWHLGALTILLASMSACASAPPPRDEPGVRAVLESFYGAMKTGDTAAAMRLIAPDAVFLEGGRLETRQQYEESHLPADIEFESKVAGKRGPMQIFFEGNTAWVIVTTEYDGEFEDSPVHFQSAQLMVLTRADSGWQIRTIHWSSRPL